MSEDNGPGSEACKRRLAKDAALYRKHKMLEYQTEEDVERLQAIDAIVRDATLSLRGPNAAAGEEDRFMTIRFGTFADAERLMELLVGVTAEAEPVQGG